MGVHKGWYFKKLWEIIFYHIESCSFSRVKHTPQSTEVFYLDDGEPKIGPIEKVYVTTLVTPMGLASSFNPFAAVII